MFTPEERGELGSLVDHITEGLAQAVEHSFKVRPMIQPTRNEAKRRIEIAYECWRVLVKEGGYAPARALLAVPTLMTEVIDREKDSVAPGLIETPFMTKMLPHNMHQKIQAERSLSALARKHGTVDSLGPIGPELIIKGE